MDSAQIVIFVFTTKSRITWAKVVCFSDSRRKTRRYNKGGGLIHTINIATPYIQGVATGELWFSGQ